MSESGYEMCEPFDVDNGELEGVPPNEIFALGVEWDMVRQAAKFPAGFSRPIHAHNGERIKNLLARAKRRFVLTYMADDPSEAWMSLSVAPMENENGED